VKATGKVGLSLEGDFFKTINYDILYEPSGTYLTVRNLAINWTILVSSLLLPLLKGIIFALISLQTFEAHIEVNHILQRQYSLVTPNTLSFPG